jgi:ribosomal protein S18 acetylase RimI-like enzyme
MELIIREVKPNDVRALVRLVREFAAYENLSDLCAVTNEKLSGTMFGKQGFVRGLIALDGEMPIGYALFYPSFSSFRCQPGLYLEDIYISAEYRDRGIGEKLIRGIARLASEDGFERIDFMVLDWNTAAIDFYFHLGAVRDEDERHFKFTDAAFQNLAAQV